MRGLGPFCKKKVFEVYTKVKLFEKIYFVLEIKKKLFYCWRRSWCVQFFEKKR